MPKKKVQKKSSEKKNSQNKKFRKNARKKKFRKKIARKKSSEKVQKFDPLKVQKFLNFASRLQKEALFVQKWSSEKLRFWRVLSETPCFIGPNENLNFSELF